MVKGQGHTTYINLRHCVVDEGEMAVFAILDIEFLVGYL